MTRTPVLTGGCQCGRVRYALYASPTGALCHCRMCQRATGGPFAALTGVPKADFAWTAGEPAVFASSTAADRAFCRDCGTPLTFVYRRGDFANVMAGTLDDPEAANIALQTGVQSRLSWLKLCDGLPEENTGDDPADRYKTEGLVSHQAVEPAP